MDDDVTGARSGQQDHRARSLRRVGLAVAALPAAVVLLFAVGEGVGSEPGWWGHLLQLALVVPVLVVAWRWPRVGGPLLIAFGVASAVLVVALRPGADALTGAVGVLLLPFVVAGVLLVVAERRSGSGSADR